MFYRPGGFDPEGHASRKGAGVAADIGGIKEIPLEVMPTTSRARRGQQEGDRGGRCGPAVMQDNPNQQQTEPRQAPTAQR